MRTIKSGNEMSFVFRLVTLLGVLLAILIPAAAETPQPGRIAFVGNQSGSWQIYTMNPDGSSLVQVTDLPPSDWEIMGPHISKDGKKILFTYGATDASGNLALDLYLMNVDGTGITQLTHDGRSLFGILSPDGNTVAFCHSSVRTGLCQLAATSVSGKGGVTALTNDLWDNLPDSFTPDGKQIVFDSQQGGFISAVWIMNANGSRSHRLTEPALKASPGDVSPDGQHVTFINNQNSPLSLPNAIFEMNIDGSSIRQVTQPGIHHDLGGSYSPDGTHVVFASDRATVDTSLDVYTVGIDGNDIQRIATGITVGGCQDYNCVNANWGPKPKS
jgi:Tol biopolymer transport system component